MVIISADNCQKLEVFISKYASYLYICKLRNKSVKLYHLCPKGLLYIVQGRSYVCFVLLHKVLYYKFVRKTFITRKRQA